VRYSDDIGGIRAEQKSEVVGSLIGSCIPKRSPGGAVAGRKTEAHLRVYEEASGFTPGPRHAQWAKQDARVKASTNKLMRELRSLAA
jgi:hypothetical protein